MTEQVNIKEFQMEDIPLSCTWIVVGPPGSGKCLDPNTPVLMFDNTIKKAKEIKIQDKLMGDDYCPKWVISTTSGKDNMYKIKQSKGEDYIVNEPHILSLYNSTIKKVIDIKVTDYLKLNKQKKQYLKGCKAIYRNNVDTNNLSKIEIKSLGNGEYYGFEISDDPNKMSGNGRFLLGDRTITHNTSFIENMCYYLKHRYPVGRAWIGTEGGYKKFCDIFHPIFVSNYYDEIEQKKHIVRQRTCELENGKGHPSNYAIDILDDVSDDPKIYRSKVMRGLFKLGSQHWHQLLMVGSQYAIDMPPDVRKSVSYVAMFFEPEEIERKKLHVNFGGLAGNYKQFSDLMDQVTGDYTCLIFKKRTQSYNMEDNIFYYKTRLLKDWKFGCKEYRKWGKERYNPDYQEKIEM